MLRDVIVKIGLEKNNTQKGEIVEVLLNSGVIEFVLSWKIKIKRLIYIRNVDKSFNKEGPIEHMVKVNIYYQGHRERTEINMIGG